MPQKGPMDGKILLVRAQYYVVAFVVSSWEVRFCDREWIYTRQLLDHCSLAPSIRE